MQNKETVETTVFQAFKPFRPRGLVCVRIVVTQLQDAASAQNLADHVSPPRICELRPRARGRLPLHGSTPMTLLLLRPRYPLARTARPVHPSLGGLSAPSTITTLRRVCLLANSSECGPVYATMASGYSETTSTPVPFRRSLFRSRNAALASAKGPPKLIPSTRRKSNRDSHGLKHA